jgi:hypothetical protein
MADGGELQKLIDVLIASLAMTQAPVTSSERNELGTLAEAMDLPTDQLAGLNVSGLVPVQEQPGTRKAGLHDKHGPKRFHPSRRHRPPLKPG